MGTFGGEFSVALELQPSPAGEVDDHALAQAHTNTNRLQEAINLVHDGGGGYVQIPPGRFLLGRRRGVEPASPERSIDGGDLLVHEDVILWFTPGAVLVPLGPAYVGARDSSRPDLLADSEGVCIELQGGIRAARRKIFDPMVDSLVQAGLVVFAGDQVREILPEWWGAGTGFPAFANRRGLQAALNAAHRDRFRVLRDVDGIPRRDGQGRTRWQRSPLPVVLTGEYPIDRELVVGALDDTTRPVNRSGFVLRGEHGVGSTGAGRPALVAASRALDGLLAVHGVSGFRVEDVTFNASHAARGVLVEDLRGDGAESVFEGCAFLNATSALVEVIGRNFQVAEGAAPGLLSFRRCRLETMPLGDARALRLQHGAGDSDTHVGLRLDAKESVLVELRNCFLTGPANPFVLARSGWFSLRECTSHVLRHFDPRPANGPGGINEERSTRNGTDLYLDMPTSPSSINSGGLLEPASFTARECESQSWQFLGSSVSVSAMSANTARTSSLVLNLNHAANAEITPSTVSLEDQPSIFWDGPARTGSDLILMGVLLTPRHNVNSTADELTRHSGTHGGYLHVVGGIDGRVFDLGIASRGALEPPEYCLTSLGAGERWEGSSVVFGADRGISSVQVYRVPLVQ